MSWTWFLAGVVFVAISFPLIQRRVPPNRWYGFRTAKTLSSKSVWYEANHVAGLDLLAAGMAIVLTATVTAILGAYLPADLLTGINFAVFMLVLGWAVVHGFLVLRRL